MGRVILLGGLDPSGGAGISVDATVVSLLGGAPLPIALAATVQGLRGFSHFVSIDESLIREQLAVVLADGPVRVVKVGFIGSAKMISTVADALQSLVGEAEIIVDPVLSATAGGMGMGDELVAGYREHLIPIAGLVTPNALELDRLADGDARALLDLGAKAVLQKGGHGTGPRACDQLFLGEQATGRPYQFERERFDCGPVRGTGCALASAIATNLADRHSLIDSCRMAGDWLGAMLSRVRPRPSGLPRHLPFHSASGLVGRR